MNRRFFRQTSAYVLIFLLVNFQSPPVENEMASLAAEFQLSSKFHGSCLKLFPCCDCLWPFRLSSPSLLGDCLEFSRSGRGGISLDTEFTFLIALA